MLSTDSECKFHLLALSMGEKVPFEIIKETPYWIAVNKPTGVIVEKNPYESLTMEGQVSAHLQQKTKQPFVGVVHRLDKATSGVLIFAKKRSALKKLNRQFEERSVQKIYWALVDGELPSNTGQLDHWLVKDAKTKRANIVEETVKEAKKASLLYKVLAEKGDITLVEITLLTGRYHQIRAQFAAIACPIIGDLKYRQEGDEYAKEIALHARELTIRDPQRENERNLKAPLPAQAWWDPFRGKS